VNSGQALTFLSTPWTIAGAAMAWLAVAAKQPLDWAVANGLTPFLVGDALKLVVAAVAFPAAWWLVGRRPGDR